MAVSTIDNTGLATPLSTLQVTNLTSTTSTVTTLNAPSGILASQNGMNGIAKAWVTFSGLTSPGTISASYNVSSVTKNGTGDYTINFSNAFANANYAIVCTSADTFSYQRATGNYSGGQTTTTARVLGYNCTNGTALDNPYNFVVVFNN
jgi:hypothetical protein